MNPKLIAALQTVFYGVMFAIIPVFVQNLGAGGALNGFLPEGVTALIVFGLNYLENQIEKKTGRAVFGAVQSSSK